MASINCAKTTACRCCSNNIFTLDFTLGFNKLRKDNCMTRRETFKVLDLVRLLKEIWRYASFQKLRHSRIWNSLSRKTIIPPFRSVSTVAVVDMCAPISWMPNPGPVFSLVLKSKSLAMLFLIQLPIFYLHSKWLRSQITWRNPIISVAALRYLGSL